MGDGSKPNEPVEHESVLVMEIADFTTFCHVIRHLGEIHELSVTSWGRTESRNKMVGGHLRSRHMDWMAVDVVPDDWDKHAEIMEDAGRLGLKAINEGDHIHLQVA